MGKGPDRIDSDTFFTDEQLVVSAVVDAIVGRREAIVMTTDNDVQEQFRKLLILMDHQYQAFLFAERFAAEPHMFSTKPMVRNTRELLHFYANDGLLVEKPTAPGRVFVEWLLPKDYLTIPIYVLLFGGVGPNLQFSPLSYAAERDFIRLLEVKGQTGGLNTDKLEGRNCHPAFVKGIEEPRRWMTVAEDHFALETDMMRYPLLDVAAANFERGDSVQ